PSFTCTRIFLPEISERGHLSDADQRESGAPTSAEMHIDGIAMVQLLGPQDRLLTRIEHEHPDVSVHVRGNKITLTGPTESVAATRELIEQLLVLVRNGQDL